MDTMYTAENPLYDDGMDMNQHVFCNDMLEINSLMVSNPLFEEEDALSDEEDVLSICESDLHEVKK